MPTQPDELRIRINVENVFVVLKLNLSAFILTSGFEPLLLVRRVADGPQPLW